jgi:tetratricopeptide (TPR) repeat protein
VDRPSPAQLDDRLVAAVTALCEQGDDAVEAERYPDAIAHYREALALVPSPVHRWAVTTWIHGAIAEAHYLAGELTLARDSIDDAFRCEGAIGNAFLHLRLGQIELQLGNRGRALDELIRAFTRAGEEVFAGEEPRYLALVKAALAEDAG